ncbi:MAG: diguanylate cyclase [Lachnospiraceae bacterium]|nr:diguanylate cyclase [Lachnospiraceae bacterium]
MKHILIVDDSNMYCIIAKNALESTYRISLAHSGPEALAFLEKEIPDLILMDIEMPKMSGKEVLRQIKSHKEWSKIPVMFMTALSELETEAECLELGADDFITKPIKPLIMASRVSKLLELYDLRKDLEHQLMKRTQQMEMATLKSLTDALTGLHNRDYLEKKLNELLEEGHAGALFMIDLDNFKGINDTYGHIVGDKTLQIFAEVLRTYSREDDVICRLAGDEFVTFYPELTDREIAAKKAGDIIKLFNERMASLGYPDVVSVSIGIMMATGDEDYVSLYNNADKSLYYVKNNGKNSYHFYGEQKISSEKSSTEVDLEVVHRMMEQGVVQTGGAFSVAYEEFQKLYDFVIRYVERKKQEIQIVLFTLRMGNEYLAGISMDSAMEILEKSVVSSLRAMDAGTKYSNKQYIVLLMDTDTENGKKVADRVIRKFYQNAEIAVSGVNVSYDIQARKPQ